jgi:hypothetical protein
MGKNEQNSEESRPATHQQEQRRSEFLPEPVYFRDVTNSALKQADAVTARCVVRWGTDYLAYPLSDRSLVRKGPLPSDVQARESLIDELYRWAEELGRTRPLRTVQVGLVLHLSRGDGPLLDTWDDGMPRRLLLTPEEFRVLQDCWAEHHLPRDLFYPSTEKHHLVEPMNVYGSVVLARREYSPLEWARRDVEAISALKVPTEEERRVRFLEAIDQFQRALSIRRAELREPGKETDPEELRELGLLYADLWLIRGRALQLDEGVLHQIKEASERAHCRPRTRPGKGVR